MVPVAWYLPVSQTTVCVFDLVEAGGRHGVRGDHGGAAGGETRVVVFGFVRGAGGLAAAAGGFAVGG
jgi:hypothetical protein